MKQLVISGLALAAFFMTSCNQHPSGKEATSPDVVAAANAENNNEERNKQVIMKGVEAVNQHRPAEIFKEAAPDMVDYGDGMSAPARGKDSVLFAIQTFFNAFPDFKIGQPVYAADGDKVFMYAENSGTWKGEFMGMKPTGKSFRVKDVDIFTFNQEGKITEHRNVQSTMQLFNGLGAQLPK